MNVVATSHFVVISVFGLKRIWNRNEETNWRQQKTHNTHTIWRREGAGKDMNRFRGSHGIGFGITAIYSRISEEEKTQLQKVICPYLFLSFCFLSLFIHSFVQLLILFNYTFGCCNSSYESTKTGWSSWNGSPTWHHYHYNLTRASKTNI